jgi:hypothetical protein
VSTKVVVCKGPLSRVAFPVIQGLRSNVHNQQNSTLNSPQIPHHVAVNRCWPFLPNDVRSMRISSLSTELIHCSAALDETARKSRKAKNKSGNPIKLPSKILAVAADPHDAWAVYVAEAAGTVKRVVLEVCKMTYYKSCRTSLTWSRVLRLLKHSGRTQTRPLP